MGAGEAKFYGFLQELLGGNGSSANSSNASKNMDYWNNDVGRKKGENFNGTKEALLKRIHEALKNGELIINPKDPRKHGKDLSYIPDSTKPIIVVKESKTGRNELFIDTVKGNVMDRDSFVSLIQSGDYPSYQVSTINDVATPMSKPDGTASNNLG